MHANNSIAELHVIKSYEDLEALFKENGNGPFCVQINFTPLGYSKQTTTTTGMLYKKNMDGVKDRWDCYFSAQQEIVVTYGDETPNVGLSYTLRLKKDTQFMTPNQSLSGYVRLSYKERLYEVNMFRLKEDAQFMTHNQSLSDYVILRYKDRLYEGDMKSGEMTTNDGVKIEIEHSDKVSLNDIAFYNNGTRTIGRPQDTQTIRTIEDNFDNVVILGKGVDVTCYTYGDMRSIRGSYYELKMPVASFVIIAIPTDSIKITAKSEVELILNTVKKVKVKKGRCEKQIISQGQIKNIIEERLNEALNPKLNATQNINKEKIKSGVDIKEGGLEIDNLEKSENGNESSDGNNVNEENAKTKSKNASCTPGCGIF